MGSKRGAWMIGLFSCVAICGPRVTPAATAPPKIGAHAIGGTVLSESGPEPGVWVIAETSDVGNRLVKIVVTDEHGRFVLPDLPQAKYKVWSRGYGLLDSNRTESAPGKLLTIHAVVA